jgi:hypothetical protein
LAAAPSAQTLRSLPASPNQDAWFALRGATPFRRLEGKVEGPFGRALIARSAQARMRRRTEEEPIQLLTDAQADITIPYWSI